MSEDRPQVLVVEDEPDLADLYATWLQDDYDVQTAYGGREALDTLDDSVDVILLDRRMPDLSGDEVLDAIRDRGVDCEVAMVTAVEPDFDIVEMGFDDYLVKPVSRDALHETVSSLVRHGEYGEGVQDLYALSSKKALLESKKSQSELENNEEYQELCERLEAKQAELDQTVAQFGEKDVESIFREFETGDESSGDELSPPDDLSSGDDELLGGTADDPDDAEDASEPDDSDHPDDAEDADE